MMAVSSSSITGLRSHKVPFSVSESVYEAQGWMRVVEGEGMSTETSKGWTEELTRAIIGGWWAGERTGDVVTKVSAFWRSRRLLH